MKTTILLVKSTILIGLFFGSVSAGTTCGLMTQQGQVCTASVDMKRMSQAYASQRMSQWCWAASISMLFAYAGHPLAQEKIVMASYGRTVDLPAGNGWEMAKHLNREWVDDNGKKFSSRLTAAYDSDARIAAINNAWMIGELHVERPFVIGARNHAVVAVAITFTRDGYGRIISINDIKVVDPWPGRGLRSLELDEVVPIELRGSLRFAATATVFNRNG